MRTCRLVLIFRYSHFVANASVHTLGKFLHLASLTALGDRSGIGDPLAAFKDKRILVGVLHDDEWLSIHDRPTHFNHIGRPPQAVRVGRRTGNLPLVLSKSTFLSHEHRSLLMKENGPSRLAR